MTRPIRILALGGDSSLWVALNKSFGDRASQMFFPNKIDVGDLLTASSDADIIVVVCSSSDGDSIETLKMCKDLGLERKTIAIADSRDDVSATSAVALGIAGFISAGREVQYIVQAIAHVLRQGMILDLPAADVLAGRVDFSELDPDRQMNAARALASALELKDTYTGGHAERVAGMAMRLAETALMEEALPDEILNTAFLLHDVGKIGIPESILTKPGGLTHTERRVMQTHPILGERVIEPLGFPEPIRSVVRHHHEWWDGSGYPDGLSGREIPVAARLFSIADAIDAMTSTRPYRLAISFEEAVKEVLDCAGRQFDPDIARIAEKAFLEGPRELVETHN